MKNSSSFWKKIYTSKYEHQSNEITAWSDGISQLTEQLVSYNFVQVNGLLSHHLANVFTSEL